MEWVYYITRQVYANANESMLTEIEIPTLCTSAEIISLS